MGSERPPFWGDYCFCCKLLPKDTFMLDLMLAIAHHLLIFTIFGTLFAEFWALRSAIGVGTVQRLASLDLWYGASALLVIVVGFCRAIFAAKGWAYYSHNAFFWGKIGSFALIGLLSVRPTITFIRWRNSALLPTDADIKAVRRYLNLELALFAFLPIFAAAMARGHGEF
jgi:putative membrane protein